MAKLLRALARARATLNERDDPPGYCLSYTSTLSTFLPAASVPVVVVVRVLPSADTTVVNVWTGFPPSFRVPLIVLAVRESDTLS
jgi:hypothetical protein